MLLFRIESVKIIVIFLKITSVFSDFSTELNENYKLVYPKLFTPTSQRHKRNVENFILIELENFTLELERNFDFIFAQNTTIHYINEHETINSTFESPDCIFLRGKVRNFISNTAITICEDNLLTGFLNINETLFLLQPANTILKNSTDSNKAHVLIKSDYLKSKQRPKRDLAAICYTTEFDNLTESFENEKRKFDEDWIIELGDSDTSEEISDEREDEVEIVEHSSWKKEDPNEMGYFYDSAWEAHTFKKKYTKKISAPRRWLELAVGVDYTVIQFHGKNKVQRYILALLNIVSAIYQDPSLESNLQLVLTRMILYDHKKFSQIKEGNARKSLENVNAWNKKLHTTLGPGEQRHDAAIWLTRANIGGPSGYAPVGGACNPARSCTLNRDEGLTSAFIIAHEMAHVLGLTHDGDEKANNFCTDEASEGSVMAAMVSATFSKFTWSSCSKKEFHQRAANWHCLKNPPPGKTEVIIKPALHTTFSMDEQCRMEFGDGFKMCEAFNIIEPCSHLWCGHKDTPLVCKTKKGPPLEGTECGRNKFCINGYCELDTYGFQSDPVTHNSQDGGWSNWTPWGPCSKTCKFGVQFRSRFCNNPHPAYGGSYCKGDPEEFQVCGKESCPESAEDSRAVQCARLQRLVKFKDSLKRSMTWLPYESEKKALKCKLICLSQQTGEIFSSGENLLDGTRCSYDDENDICIQGICYPLGCDGSHSKRVFEDTCGICGGNNSLCINLTSNFQRNIKREISRIGIIPRLSRNIKIECRLDTVRNNTGRGSFLMLRDRLKGIRYNLTVYEKFSNTFIIRGTKFHYSKRGNLLKLWAKGPLLEEIIVSLYANSNAVNSGISMGITSSYSVKKEHVIKKPKYSWIFGGWGSCSASCGGGRRLKTITCKDLTTNKIVPKRFCSLTKKPPTVIEECNKFSCRFHWVADEWEHCTATCGSSGLQSREVYCVHYTINAKTFSNRTRSKLWQHAIQPDQCLTSEKPESQRPCNRIPCTTYWEPLDWSQCSVSCGIGTETQDYHCPPPKNESVYTCGPKPKEKSRKCRITRHDNPQCKNRKRKSCDKDKVEVCALTDYLGKYCALREFRKICCKSCFNKKYKA